MKLKASHAAFLVAMLAATVARADSYTVTDLGTLGGAGSYAYGINASGQVVGYSHITGNSNAFYQAFLFSGGAMSDLGTFGGHDSYATGINATGQVVGYAQTTGNAQHAFLYS